jgi:dCTP deaminase
MIFSDRQIRRALESGRFAISPKPTDNQYAPSAVDLHVGNEFKRWKAPPVGMLQQLRLSEVNIPDYTSFLEDIPREDDGGVVIQPGAFVLSQTLERVVLPADSRLAARVEGRSSYARLGLVVHMTAPTIHAGFEGTIVLEMMNFGPFPLLIDPNHTLLCQLIFEELGDDPQCAISTPFHKQSTVLGDKDK